MREAHLGDLEGTLVVRTVLLRGGSAVNVGNSNVASHLLFSELVVILDFADCSVPVERRLRQQPHWLARDLVLVYVV